MYVGTGRSSRRPAHGLDEGGWNEVDCRAFHMKRSDCLQHSDESKGPRDRCDNSFLAYDRAPEQRLVEAGFIASGIHPLLIAAKNIS
jgi:hypothetical protein